MGSTTLREKGEELKVYNKSITLTANGETEEKEMEGGRGGGSGA